MIACAGDKKRAPRDYSCIVSTGESNKMKHSVLIAVCLSIAAICGQAEGSLTPPNSIDFDHMGISSRVILHAKCNKMTIPAGEIYVNYTDIGGATVETSVFCVDVFHGMGNAPYRITPTTPWAYGGSKAQKAAWLYISNFSSSMSGIEAAGLQIAMWEVLHENDANGYDATDGDVWIENICGNDVISSATTFLGYLSGVTDFSEGDTAIILQSDSGCRQSVITIPPTVVPEPATMGLLALGGIAALRRRRTN